MYDPGDKTVQIVAAIITGICALCLLINIGGCCTAETDVEVKNSLIWGGIFLVGGFISACFISDSVREIILPIPVMFIIIGILGNLIKC